jgi:hypothetical protein
VTATPGTPLEATVERALSAHEGHWTLLAFTLRALDDDEQAGAFLRRHVRDDMARALLAGYEGREPTPKRPGVDHIHKADEWVGVQLLRDVGPRGLSEIDWTALGGRLTQLAGPRICDRPPR